MHEPANTLVIQHHTIHTPEPAATLSRVMGSTLSTSTPPPPSLCLELMHQSVSWLLSCQTYFLELIALSTTFPYNNKLKNNEFE